MLTPDELSDALQRLPGWSGTVTDGITRTVEHPDFVAAMAFVNTVARIAEARNHHPDIAISWGTVTLSIISHSAGGVTTDCVALAAALDQATS